LSSGREKAHERVAGGLCEGWTLDALFDWTQQFERASLELLDVVIVQTNHSDITPNAFDSGIACPSHPQIRCRVQLNTVTRRELLIGLRARIDNDVLGVHV